MVRYWISALRLFFVLTILTGILYPLLITAFAQLVFPEKANGSLVIKDGKPVGSRLLAQKFATDRYFWPRPSANNYDALNSGGTNLAPTSAKLRDTVQATEKTLGAGAPNDLLFASASGLDPEISPLAAKFQVTRIAKARGLAIDSLLSLVDRATQSPQLGFLGEARVNVLALNLLLDAGQP